MTHDMDSPSADFAALLASRQLSQIPKGWSLVQYVSHKQLRGKELKIKTRVKNNPTVGLSK
jgi:hypothetical protein